LEKSRMAKLEVICCGKMKNGKGGKRCGIIYKGKTEKIDSRDAAYDVGFCFRKTERVTIIQRFF